MRSPRMPVRAVPRLLTAHNAHIHYIDSACVHRESGRQCALKVLEPTAASRREVRALFSAEGEGNGSRQGHATPQPPARPPPIADCHSGVPGKAPEHRQRPRHLRCDACCHGNQRRRCAEGDLGFHLGPAGFTRLSTRAPPAGTLSTPAPPSRKLVLITEYMAVSLNRGRHLSFFSFFSCCPALPLPRIQGGELFDRIRKKRVFTEAEASDVMRQIADGLLHCHRHRIAHRDIKPENLLYESDVRPTAGRNGHRKNGKWHDSDCFLRAPAACRRPPLTQPWLCLSNIGAGRQAEDHGLWLCQGRCWRAADARLHAVLRRAADPRVAVAHQEEAGPPRCRGRHLRLRCGHCGTAAVSADTARSCAFRLLSGHCCNQPAPSLLYSPTRQELRHVVRRRHSLHSFVRLPAVSL